MSAIKVRKLHWHTLRHDSPVQVHSYSSIRNYPWGKKERGTNCTSQACAGGDLGIKYVQISKGK